MNINKEIDNKALIEAFKNDCKVINLKNEYAGYDGDVMWAIVSELSDEDLEREYKSIILIYSPYLRLTTEQYQAFRSFDSNEHKHYMRMLYYGDQYSVDEELFFVFHAEIAACDSENIDWSWLYNIIDKLSLTQKRRIVKKFYYQMNNAEIAREERVSSQAIDLSVNTALNKIKKLIEKNKKSISVCGMANN